MINNSGTTITIKPTIITSPAYKHSHIHVAKATRLTVEYFTVVNDNPSLSTQALPLQNLQQKQLKEKSK